MASKKKIGEILVDQKIISPQQLSEALEKQKKYSLPLGEIVILMELVTENRLLKALGRHLDVEFLNIAENNYQVIDQTLAGLVPRDTCQRLRVVPVFFLDDGVVKQVTLAMSDPLNEDAIKEIQEATEAHVVPVLTTSSAIIGGIEKLYEKKSVLPSAAGRMVVAEEDQVVKYVNKLLYRAVQMNASDIHIEPHSMEVHIRYRIDGVLQLIESIPLSEIAPIIIRIKIMGSEKQSLMRIDEKRIPQDGSLARVIGGHAVDFRVATFPPFTAKKLLSGSWTRTAWPPFTASKT